MSISRVLLRILLVALLLLLFLASWGFFPSRRTDVYILHYALVSWLQYELLHIETPAVFKAIWVMSGAMLLSLGVVYAWSRLSRNA